MTTRPAPEDFPPRHPQQSCSLEGLAEWSGVPFQRAAEAMRARLGGPRGVQVPVVAAVLPLSPWIKRIPEPHAISGGLVEALPGATLEQALDHTAVVADITLQETLLFNGVLIPVCPKSDLSELVAAYHMRPCRFEPWDEDTETRLRMETMHREAAMLFYCAGLTALYSDPEDGVSVFAAKVMRRTSDSYKVAAERLVNQIKVRGGWGSRLISGV